jgi:hypothetical protein
MWIQKCSDKIYESKTGRERKGERGQYGYRKKAFPLQAWTGPLGVPGV